MDEKTQKEVKERFRRREINYLVTVNQLDEGINFPWMSLYVDTSRSVHPRRFTQRVGRILRTFVGKERAEVLTFMDINNETLKSNFEFYRRLKHNDDQVIEKSKPSKWIDNEIEIIDQDKFFLELEKKEFWINKHKNVEDELVIPGNGGNSKERSLHALSHWLEKLEERGLPVRYPKSKGNDLLENESTLYRRLTHPKVNIFAKDLFDPNIIKLLGPKAQEIIKKHLWVNDSNSLIVEGVGITPRDKAISALSHWFEQLEKNGLQVRFPKSLGENLFENEANFYQRLVNYRVKIYSSDIFTIEFVKLLSPKAQEIIKRRIWANDSNSLVVDGIGNTTKQKAISALSHWFEQLEKRGLPIRFPKSAGEETFEDERRFYQRLRRSEVKIKIEDLSNPEFVKLLSPQAQEIVKKRFWQNDPDLLIVEGIGRTSKERAISALSHWFEQLEARGLTIRFPKTSGDDLLEGEADFCKSFKRSGIFIYATDMLDTEFVKKLSPSAQEIVKKHLWVNDPSQLIVEGIGTTHREKTISAFSHWLEQLKEKGLPIRYPKSSGDDLLEGEAEFLNRITSNFNRIYKNSLNDPEFVKLLSPKAQEIVKKNFWVNDPNKFVVEGIGTTPKEKVLSAISHWFEQLENKGLPIHFPKGSGTNLLEGKKNFYTRLTYKSNGIRVKDLRDPEFVKLLSPNAQEIVKKHFK